ncbi:MAG: SEC-C domain-containing protein [Acidobacteria bacterium]|nr:SEC-C domain-containing protein [Acidobacteriota bacterium]
MSQFTPAQVTVIHALAIGATVSAAAKLADVSRTTVYAWLTDPHFHEAYGYAHQEYAMTIRDRLQDMAAKALARLEAVLDNPNASPSVILKATLAILNQAKDWTLPSASFENCSKEILAAQRRIAAEPDPPEEPAAAQAAPPHLTKLNTNSDSTPRNAPCPCGSGHKFKRCCGRNAPPVLTTEAA